MSVYVCSDIHGQYTLYQKMLEEINFSDSDTLYILGDMIDRGPESIELLKDVMQRRNVQCLLGNHELMMYEYYQHAKGEDAVWEYPNNGGRVTRKAFEKLTEDEQRTILDFVGDLPLQLEVTAGGTTFLLSHSSFLPDRGDAFWKSVPYRDAKNVVWNSPWRFWEYIPLSDYALDGRQHVIGHVPVQAVAKTNTDARERTCNGTKAYVDRDQGIVNIDLGCALMNRHGRHSAGLALCCMDLEKFARGETDDAFLYIRQNNTGKEL